MLKRMRLVLLTIGLLLYGLAHRSLAEHPADITVGSKNFTESLILGELYAQSLEKAGYRVARKFNLGGTLIAHAALVKGEIDLYPEYTGSGLLNVLHQPPMADKARIFRTLSEQYEKRWHLRWLTPSEANDSQGLVITRATADKYHLATLSQLARLAPQLRLASLPEFEQRADGLKGLQQTYGGFRFKQTQLYNIGLKYPVLRQGQADVTIGFTTDGQLSDPDLVLLADDKGFWPPYQVAPILREAVIAKAPLAVGIANRLSAALDTRTLQRLNAAVDLQGQDYRTVARTFLAERGL